MSKSVFMEFLEGIPANKLEGFPPGKHTLYSQRRSDGQNYRLDKQGTTSDGYENLQIQANKQARSTSVRKKEAPNSVATVLVLSDTDPAVGPEEVRAAFKQSYRGQGKIIRLGTKPAEEDKWKEKDDKKRDKNAKKSDKEDEKYNKDDRKNKKGKK